MDQFISIFGIYDYPLFQTNDPYNDIYKKVKELKMIED